tara:strand:- start:5162 stop:7384 length:2223 start_codon:yes stop_codon:yes gene_type:complete
MYPELEEDRVAYWQNQIAYSQQKAKPLFDACDVLQKQYYNEASTDREATEGEDYDEDHVRRTKSGLIFGWIDQSIANMLDRAPVFKVHPQNRNAAERLDAEDPQSLSYAQAVEKVVNYRYRETNQLRVDERIVLDAFLNPYGVVKLGYTLDTDELKNEFVAEMEGALDADEDPEEENTLLAIGQPLRVETDNDHQFHIESHKALRKELMAQFKLEKRSKAERAPILSALDNHITLHKQYLDRPEPAANSNIRRGAPYAVRWRPDMFLTDPFSEEGPNDARWIAFGWELPLAEVQANPGYKNTDQIEPTRYEDAPQYDEGEEVEDGFDVVRGWEIWARNFPIAPGKFRNILVTIVEGSDVFIQEEEEWPYDRIDDYPVEIVSYHAGINSWYHLPTLLLGGGDTVQALINEILDSFLSTIRKQKNVWLVDPKLGINKTIIADMLDAPDGSVIEVPGLAERGASNAILPMPFQQVPNEKNEMMSLLQQMFDRSVGTPQPVAMPSTETATEASIFERRNTSRENRRSALLSEFQVRKARKMLQMDLQYLPDQLFFIDRSAASFVEITAEMARGEYWTTMDVTSHAAAINVERKQLMDLLNLFSGMTPLLVESFGLPANIPELARRVLVRGFSEETVEELLPMLEYSSNMLRQQGAQKADQIQQQQAAMQPGMAPEQAGQEGLPQQPIRTQQGRAPEFTDPTAAAAQDAILAGQTADTGIGPIDPSAFNRNTANEGGQAGEAEAS